MRTFLLILILSSVLPAADDGVAIISLRNQVAEVVLSPMQGRVVAFRLLGVKPIEYYGWHEKALRAKGVRLPDPAKPLAVLDAFNPHGGAHNAVLFVGLPTQAGTVPWQGQRLDDRHAQFVWKDDATGRCWTISYELSDGKSELITTYVVDNAGTADLDMTPTVVSVNGVHQDDPTSDAYYVCIGRHYGGVTENNIENLGMPETGKDLPVSSVDLDYVVLKSRFFAALVTPGGLSVSGGAKAEAPVVVPTESIGSQPITPVGVPAAPVASLPGAAYALQVSARGYDLPAELGGTKQAYIKMSWSANGAPIRILPGQKATMQWRLTATAFDKAGLERLSVIERKAEFTEGYYRFFKVLSKACTWLLDVVVLVVRNYGVAILVLTFLIKLALHRTTFKQQESMMKMQKLQPEIKLLQETYKNDRQKLGQKQMELWKKHGVNPLGGCLPILIQIPIFTALFMAFSHSADMRGQGFLWVKDLTLPDAVWGFALPWTLPLIGGSLSVNPLPIIYIGVTVWMSLSQKMPTGGDPAQEQTMKMMRWMPVVFGIIFYSMPAGLVLYFTANAVLSTIEIRMVKRKLGIS